MKRNGAHDAVSAPLICSSDVGGSTSRSVNGSTALPSPSSTTTVAPWVDVYTGALVDPLELERFVFQLPIPPKPFDRSAMVIWIASLYHDTVQPRRAARILREEIRRHRTLEMALHFAGWHQRKRTFTPRQIAVVFHFLGPASAPTRS